MLVAVTVCLAIAVVGTIQYLRLNRDIKFLEKLLASQADANGEIDSKGDLYGQNKNHQGQDCA